MDQEKAREIAQALFANESPCCHTSMREEARGKDKFLVCTQCGQDAAQHYKRDGTD